MASNVTFMGNPGDAKRRSAFWRTAMRAFRRQSFLTIAASHDGMHAMLEFNHCRIAPGKNAGR